MTRRQFYDEDGEDDENSDGDDNHHDKDSDGDDNHHDKDEQDQDDDDVGLAEIEWNGRTGNLEGRSLKYFFEKNYCKVHSLHLLIFLFGLSSIINSRHFCVQLSHCVAS